VSVPAGATPAGNVTDKYGTANPVARILVRRWMAALDVLAASAEPRTVLDVGCGEGVNTQRWAAALRPEHTVGVDIGAEWLAGEWAGRTAPGLTFAHADAHALPFDADEFELVCAVELLEHVADPASVLRELCRCTSRHVLLSVPREPLWRVLNVARGAYLTRLGDTPGHVHHWSRPGFAEFAARYGHIVAVRSPLPWTVVLLELG
jgi:ubiquinone/menaquinone biosynthesis C-methylase UbiE